MLSERVFGEAWRIPRALCKGQEKQKSESRRSPYLEPFTWFGLHSILMVTLAGGCDSQSC